MKFALLFLLSEYFPAFSLAKPTDEEVIPPLTEWSFYPTCNTYFKNNYIQ
ncbi:hypothetical protein HMPREF9446_01674 [Bacteroides fluxus YIT 12057]|uniref:Uncharacterized protein n=1 Tax=Bacteroides fluxus YIT 12057 TaxID=763034 RepID=F3PSE0_9BACE|nr:hypothetical protein HMPREF9446_01674 [Bacteroides fluxus YIT 12057]